MSLLIYNCRAKAAAEVRKKKYEVFLQNLLIKPFLKSSDLLHLFLTANEDFSKLADLARPESSIVPDIGSIYQSVSHKLSKEKGQHLDSFLSAFLLSTDVEYHQPMYANIQYNQVPIYIFIQNIHHFQIISDLTKSNQM